MKIDKYFHLYSNKNEVVFEEVEEPEPKKKGVWLDDDGEIQVDGYCATCSVCGEMSEYLTAYCGNCGADMRGEDDDIPIEYFESGGK